MATGMQHYVDKYVISNSPPLHLKNVIFCGSLQYTNVLLYYNIYSKTCVNRPPLGSRFTAGIDSGPVYSVSTL
jgi:hypothetical protein